MLLLHFRVWRMSTFSQRHFLFLLIIQMPPNFTLFPYTTLFRSTCLPKITYAKAHHQRKPNGWPGSNWAASRNCGRRSEEHTSELQSRFELVCRLLLEKKNMWTIGQRDFP